MGGIFSKPKAPPAPPPPEPPIVQGAPGEAEITKKKYARSGRGGTLLTGHLIPRNIGKKRLLG
jgi:hypothetical protein